MLRWIPWSIAALLVACSPNNEYVAPPPAAVTVALPEQRDVTDYALFPGTTVGQFVVEVRARVKGFLAEILYNPGESVEQDQILFRIDDREYVAAVESAQADLASAQADEVAAAAAVESAEADRELATATVAKLEKAYETRAISQLQVLEAQAQRDVAAAGVDHAVAQVLVAKAHVGIAQAQLDRANLDLSYTEVRAPIQGYVTLWQVEVGALVGAGLPTLLATVIKDEVIHCYFDVSERALLAARTARRSAGLESKPRPADTIEVRMALSNEEGFPHLGVADYLEPSIDASTGTSRVRAVFQNSERMIPSGAFVMVQVPIAARKGALLITERALGNDQGGAFLMIVTDENVVEQRSVEVGRRHGDQVVILKGIAAQDRIIVSGLQRARPGTTVAPTMSDS